jgi:hypothetical protein
MSSIYHVNDHSRMEENMTKKFKILSVSILTLIVVAVLLTPYVKIWVYSRQYELIGSYFILKDNRNDEISLKPIHVDRVSYQMSEKRIDITNVLYYKDLKQLSFGLITDRNSKLYYDLSIVKKDNTNVAGNFMTEGKMHISKKSIEKIHYILEDQLTEEEEYIVKITDTGKNVVGTMKFKLPK